MSYSATDAESMAAGLNDGVSCSYDHECGVRLTSELAGA